MTHIPQPNDTDAESLFALARYASGIEPLLFPIVMLCLWVVSFIIMMNKGESGSRSWTFASFFTSVLVIPLTLMGFVSATNMYMIGIFVAVGVIWMILENNPS